MILVPACDKCGVSGPARCAEVSRLWLVPWRGEPLQPRGCPVEYGGQVRRCDELPGVYLAVPAGTAEPDRDRGRGVGIWDIDDAETVPVAEHEVKGLDLTDRLDRRA